MRRRRAEAAVLIEDYEDYESSEEEELQSAIRPRAAPRAGARELGGGGGSGGSSDVGLWGSGININITAAAAAAMLGGAEMFDGVIPAPSQPAASTPALAARAAVGDGSTRAPATIMELVENMSKLLPFNRGKGKRRLGGNGNILFDPVAFVSAIQARQAEHGLSMTAAQAAQFGGVTGSAQPGCSAPARGGAPAINLNPLAHCHVTIALRPDPTRSQAEQDELLAAITLLSSRVVVVATPRAARGAFGGMPLGAPVDLLYASNTQDVQLLTWSGLQSEPRAPAQPEPQLPLPTPEAPSLPRAADAAMRDASSPLTPASAPSSLPILEPTHVPFAASLLAKVNEHLGNHDRRKLGEGVAEHVVFIVEEACPAIRDDKLVLLAPMRSWPDKVGAADGCGDDTAKATFAKFVKAGLHTKRYQQYVGIVLRGAENTAASDDEIANISGVSLSVLMKDCIAAYPDKGKSWREAMLDQYRRRRPHDDSSSNAATPGGM